MSYMFQFCKVLYLFFDQKILWPSINGQFSMAMLNNQRVYHIYTIYCFLYSNYSDYSHFSITPTTFTNYCYYSLIYPKNHKNVGKYSIHGASGKVLYVF